MCLPIHQCSSFPRNVLHTCTTINLQKACKSSMTFSPSNHYTPSDSFLLFLSTSFKVRFPCALSLSLSLSLPIPFFALVLHWIYSFFLFSLLFFFAIMDLGLQHQNSLPTSTYEWNLIFSVESHMSKIYISLLKSCWISLKRTSGQTCIETKRVVGTTKLR